MNISKLLLLSSLFLCSTAALGNSMRCGVYLIGNNSSQYEVLKKCGEPTYRQGNEWVYESSTQFTRVITFNFDGKVMHVKTLDTK